MEDYKTIEGGVTAEIEEKKSRFIASLCHVESEAEALAFLDKIRAQHRTARHNVYAYRLREENRERYSDDGEPAKTAGTPALEVLRHSGVTDIIVVITRYFGGTLLGTGGLVRAYQGATQAALAVADICTVRSLVQLEVHVDYALYERICLLVEQAGGKMAVPQFAENVFLSWQMPEGTEQTILNDLTALTRGSAMVSVSAPYYAPF
ncbi:MAG: YigZ family protein [Faecalibacterium sp.]